MATQYQEQYQDQNPDQKQEPSARPRGLANRNSDPSATEAECGPPAHLVTAARQTLKLTSPHRPLAELVDALKISVRQNGGGDCSSVDAQKALNVALAERRVQ